LPKLKVNNIMAEDKKKKIRTLVGTVVSDRMSKTLVVAVDQMKSHPVYKKRYRVTKRYHVHDANDEYKTGDKVTFRACRPMSRTKRWYAIPREEKAE